MFLYLALVETSLLLPIFLYRVYRIIYLGELSRKEKIKNIISYVVYTIILLLFYNIVKYNYINFHIKLLIILNIFVIILEYLAIINEFY